MDAAADAVPQITVRRIQEMICDGVLAAGARLPSQRVLAEQLRVSRASLREALSMLETLGRLRTEPRRGTFVVCHDQLPIVPSWCFEQQYSASEFYQFRFVTEGYAARLAAMRAAATDLPPLWTNLSDLKRAMRERDLAATARLDCAFHRLVMDLSGNRVFSDLHSSYGAMLRQSQLLPLVRHERLWEPLLEHENIVRAIEQRDPDGASYFMHVHILRAADRSGIVLSDPA